MEAVVSDAGSTAVLRTEAWNSEDLFPWEIGGYFNTDGFCAIGSLWVDTLLEQKRMEEPRAPVHRRPLPVGALRSPNYRRYWVGALAWVMGEQVRFIAQGWLVYQLTGRPFDLGLVGLFSALPSISLTLFGGAIADRVDRRRLLIFTQSLAGSLMLGMAVLVLTHIVQVWHVFVFAVGMGSLSAFDVPARQALVPRLIDRDQLPSAVALNSAIWQGSRVIGPTLGGYLVAAVGVGPCYLFTALGYLASVTLLSRLRLVPIPADRGQQARHSNLLAGLSYIKGNPVVATLIGLSFITALFGYSYVALLPIFADRILHGGPEVFGYLEMAAGVGAILGTVAVARWGAIRHRGPVLFAGAILFGLLLLVFSLSRSTPVSLMVLFFAGAANSVYLNLAMTVVQLRVPDELRGRVLAVWGLTWAMIPLGGFQAGTVASLLGTPATVALGGLIVSAFAAALAAFVPKVRQL